VNAIKTTLTVLGQKIGSLERDGIEEYLGRALADVGSEYTCCRAPQLQHVRKPSLERLAIADFFETVLRWSDRTWAGEDPALRRSLRRPRRER
jgi:hypothetical protein